MIFGLSTGVAVGCVLVVYLGAVVQASLGIGLGMISSPFLALADPGFIPVTVVLAVIPLTIAIAWADRSHVAGRDVGLALLGRVPGVVVGALVVAALTDEVVAVLVAGSVLLAVAVSVSGRHVHTTDPVLVVAGMASGFTGTATGVGGPPMALAYQRSDPATMRSTLSAFFAVGALLSLVALTLAGEVGTRQLQLTALLLPSVALGIATARLVKDRIDPRYVRPAVLAICTVAAVALLVETL